MAENARNVKTGLLTSRTLLCIIVCDGTKVASGRSRAHWRSMSRLFSGINSSIVVEHVKSCKSQLSVSSSFLKNPDCSFYTSILFLPLSLFFYIGQRKSVNLALLCTLRNYGKALFDKKALTLCTDEASLGGVRFVARQSF